MLRLLIKKIITYASRFLVIILLGRPTVRVVNPENYTEGLPLRGPVHNTTGFIRGMMVETFKNHAIE